MSNKFWSTIWLSVLSLCCFRTSADVVPEIPSVGSIYVYNQLSCSDVNSTRSAKERLLKAENMDVKIYFEDDSKIRYVSPGIDGWDWGNEPCTVTYEATADFTNGKIKIFNILATKIAGAGCNKNVELKYRRLAPFELRAVFDEKHDRHLLLLDISKFCGGSATGEAVYEMVPMF